MRYDTALRAYTAKRIEEVEEADILVGIPCYNNQGTIEHVIQMVTHGLHKHYKGLRSVIVVADGGSTDETREVAREFQIKPWQEKIVSIYRGPAGKGSAFRSIFEAAARCEGQGLYGRRFGSSFHRQRLGEVSSPTHSGDGLSVRFPAIFQVQV